MKSYEPLNRPVAAAIKAASECLVGNRDATDTGWVVVEQIAVAPFDELNQWFYFNFFLESRDIQEALSFYNHDSFDVIVILRNQYPDGSCELSYQTLDSYLKERSAKKQPEQDISLLFDRSVRYAENRH